jgi:hypothetical protein
MTTNDMAPLDGNVAAGLLSEVFALDVTSASGRCSGCGRVDVLANAAVYEVGLGVVARCGGCTSVLLALARTPTDSWLDLRGLTHLRIAQPAPA